MDEIAESMERIVKLAKTILDVASHANIRAKEITCPHGNIPSYPSHAWWCDGCFMDLQDAIEDYEFWKERSALELG